MEDEIEAKLKEIPIETCSRCGEEIRWVPWGRPTNRVEPYSEVAIEIYYTFHWISSSTKKGLRGYLKPGWPLHYCPDQNEWLVRRREPKP